MRESPRLRRLRNDLKALAQLKADSSIFDFRIVSGDPPEAYTLFFRGNSVWRPEGSQDTLLNDRHEVSIRLNAGYPRMMPELAWRSPIFHPNISAGGVVCLGGYGTYWTPSLNLDELCTMLWDMIRYENYDVNSPYNREAAHWAKTQQRYRLPLDDRSIRDKVASQPFVADAPLRTDASSSQRAGGALPQRASAASSQRSTAPASPFGGAGATSRQFDAEVMFLDAAPRVMQTRIAPGQPVSSEIVEAEVVEASAPDVLFIE